MWSHVGCLLLSISTVSTVFVLSNTTHKIKITTPNPTLEWRENNNVIFTLSYNSTSDACNFYPPTAGFNGYCVDKGAAYELEILNTSNHDGSVFTGNNKICTIVIATNYTVSYYPVNLKPNEDVKADVVVYQTKPKPSISITITIQKEVKKYTIENTPSCNDLLGDYNISFVLTFDKLKELFGEQTFNEEKDISMDVQPFHDGVVRRFPNPNPAQTIHFIPGGSPSSPPSPSTSTSLQPTSSAPNPSTKVSSESSTSSNPTPTPPCVNLICDCDKICIIISVCVGSLIVIVVIILCCCCCPFCPCYKRKKERREGTECKCCCLICVCCRGNNKEHDEESEERVKVCESCCCFFCLCYKRRKKTSDRNSNPNKTKRASRPEKYEMPRAEQMHSYHASVPDQRARVYQPAPATGFPHPNDSHYGQGYNNAAFVYPGENERRSNKDRKPRVIQRPYTNHYYFS